MDWQDQLKATGYWGADPLTNALMSRATQAGNANYDWGPAIQKAYADSQASGGWTSGSPAPAVEDDIMSEANAYFGGLGTRVDPNEKAAAAASMQKNQAGGGGGMFGMGDFGNLALLAALGATGFGLAGMGPLAGAFGGAGTLGAMAAPGGLAEEMAALGVGDVGGGGAALAGGGMDLGGGLSVDEFGNVTGGLFQGGPGTPGSGDFFSGMGGSAGGMGLGDVSQIASIARALGLGGGGGSLAPGGPSQGGGGFDLSKLLPLLGIGSGLKTMFGNNTPAVDPSRVNSLWQAGQNTYNTSLDPQNQLHDFLQQQTVDNSRAATSARGVGMAPYAAGLENDATRNFNLNWQQQQLQRQLQGTQAFAGAGDAAARAGVANNAQAFNQNQTGLNNLTTGLGQVFGQNGLFGPSVMPGADPNLGWLSAFSGGGGATSGGGGTNYNPFPMSGNAAQDSGFPG